MATIGLYDIDMWHRGKSCPNLELMKTYNYFNTRGDRVIMMKPTDELGRFNRIIYFKDNINVDIPKNLEVTGEKKSFYGYGFYGYDVQLRPEVASLPPDFTPYDAYVTKLTNKSKYDQIKNNSLVKLSTNDFTHYNPKCKKIFFADHDPLYVEGMEEYLQEHKTKYFEFFHVPTARDEETAVKFLRYSKLMCNPIIIEGKYSEDFFYDYAEDNVLFSTLEDNFNTNNNYLARFIKMGLWYKHIGKAFRLSALPTLDEFRTLIFDWLRSSTKLSFAEFYKSNRATMRFLNGATSEIRLLLKTKPETINREKLNLKKNLMS